MIGDRIIYSERSKRNAKIIFNHLKNQKIILIGGVSGASKTESGVDLQELLLQKNKQSILFSLDDYYLVARSIRDINRKKQGIESVGLKEIDWEMIYRLIEDFETQRPVHFQRYHRYADIIEHNILQPQEVDYLIFEGLYANYLRKTFKNNLSVYLDGNPAQTLEFRTMRGKEKVQDNFRQTIVEKEYRIICQLQKYADLIIPYETNN